MVGSLKKNPAADMNSVDFLEARRSQPSPPLDEPGTDPQPLARLLTGAIRVPDHGKRTPCRQLLSRGEDRARLGEALTEIHARVDPAVPPAVLQKDRDRFNFAPLIVAVVAR